MAKKIFYFSLIIFLSATAASHAETPLEISDSSDTGLTLLMLSNEASNILYGKPIDVQNYNERLQLLSDQIGQRIGKESDPDKIIAVINHFLFKEERLTFDASDQDLAVPENMLLSSVLDEKKGNCVGLSALYLALADKLKLPFYGVNPPNHFFVRFETPQFSRNIDSAVEGRGLSDDFYKKQLQIPKEDHWYLKSLSKKENFSTYLANLAILYYEHGHTAEALGALDRALDLNPDNFNAMGDRGKILKETGRLDEALLAFDKALTINPEVAGLWNNKAMTLMAKGDLSEAEEAFRNAVRLNPKGVKERINLGNLYYQEKQMPEAKAYYEQALDLDAHSIDARIGLARIANSKHDNEESMAQYYEALLINPSSEESLLGVGASLMARSHFKDAIIKFSKLVEINPKNVEAHVNLVSCYLALDQPLAASLHALRARRLGYHLDTRVLRVLEQKRLKAVRSRKTGRSLESYYKELGIHKNGEVVR